MLIRFVVRVLIAAASTNAAAGQATLGNVSVNFPLLAGFSEPTDASPSDVQLLSTVERSASQGGEKLLGLRVDCGQLAERHTVKRRRLDDYAEYLMNAAAIRGVLGLQALRIRSGRDFHTDVDVIIETIKRFREPAE